MQSTTTVDDRSTPADLISNVQAAALLGISPTTLNSNRSSRSGAAGRTPFYRIGAARRVFYSRADVERTLRESTVRVNPAAAGA